ncbi:MAG: HmuY family protein [Prevotella sp.]|nr:HmuY family protein [Prevotella sp.]MCM1074559.1 HmuY family protein [Ruminococcus sp.]
MKLNYRSLRITGTVIGVAFALQSCTGIFDSVYDEPEDPAQNTVAGQLYIDASDWGKWYYIDLPAVAALTLEDESYNANEAWQTFDIPMQEISRQEGKWGIYTYWYDVFGAGISENKFVAYYPTEAQPEPESWTIAVHRNNVRTNGCSAAATSFKSFEEIPSDKSFLNALNFEGDRWSENEVWCEQSQMLSGLIGNQGIEINPVLSKWLAVEIPPIPPAFTINSNVFILRLADGTYGAIQLENYQSPTGVKCCLTINYRYPI